MDKEQKCMCMCGCKECGMEPKTKEDKLAWLDRKETFLKTKLEKIQKMKESVKADKPMEE